MSNRMKRIMPAISATPMETRSCRKKVKVRRRKRGRREKEREMNREDMRIRKEQRLESESDNINKATYSSVVKKPPPQRAVP